MEKPEKTQKYNGIADSIKEAINSVLWDNVTGVWFDYNLGENVLNKQFYPSNIFPMWAGITSVDGESEVPARVLNYLRNTGALNWDGGIPTSLETSSQQWDFPNAWPPLQHLFVEALENSDYEPAKDMAFDTAQKWVANNYLTYKRYNNSMFEKVIQAKTFFIQTSLWVLLLLTLIFQVSCRSTRRTRRWWAVRCCRWIWLDQWGHHRFPTEVRGSTFSHLQIHKL